MRVIGTAGHVDHGKSTLIAALTGVHPDRLKEEQEREMTIDLGFGWLSLPSGEQVGIVDVPGHRDFIENMLAGVGGIDAALLVIAADEGVMPQTREHLAILDLLQIPAGVLVLTKIDLTSDPAWLDLVESEVRKAVTGTVLQDAPCVRVSALTHQGIDQLTDTIAGLLKGKPARPDLGRPRLPIDRVFSMPGFGTVVTGTLLDGQLASGDEVVILPGGRKGRIRGLQSHKQKVLHAVPGSRTAVNLSGIETEQIERGMVLAHPDQYQSTRRMDARFRLLKDSSSEMRHGDEVKFFVGASETIATTRLLGVEAIDPGEEAWIQLELRAAIVAIRGDRFILRRPSPGETLGGGVIVDHLPGGRHKRFDDNILKSLASLAHGSPSDILLEALHALRAAPLQEVIDKSRLETGLARQAFEELLQAEQIFVLEENRPAADSDQLVIASSYWNQVQNQIIQTIEDYHKKFPLRRGMPREELKSRLKLEMRLFNTLLGRLSSENRLVESGNLVGIAGREIIFAEPQRARIQALMRKIAQHPFSPPSLKECQAELGEELLHALIDSQELIAVSPEVLFRGGDYDSMVENLRQVLRQKGRISLAEVRDLFDTSRKYAQALLEHLDAAGVTVRDGDFRRLKS